MDTSDIEEEDASEGSIGGSPMPTNAHIPPMPMHAQAQGYPASPHHFVTPQGHPGMSIMPMPPPMTEGEGVPSGKKHVCPTCFKRFNRPSSLRIHVNTHTGATPFRCPWPKCGREFNVNSNMRRHYRNHTAGSSSSSSSSNPTPSGLSNPSSVPNPHPHSYSNTRPGSGSNITNHPAIPPALRGGLHGGSPPGGHSPVPGPPVPPASSLSSVSVSVSSHMQAAGPGDERQRQSTRTADREAHPPAAWHAHAHAHNPNQFQRGYVAYRLGRDREGRQDRQAGGHHQAGEERERDPEEEIEVDELAEDSEREEMRMDVDVDEGDGRRRGVQRTASPQAPLSAPEPEEDEEGMEEGREEGGYKPKVVIDIDLRFRDLKAAVPIFTPDLSYVNNAFVRPIVAFMNANRTLVPIRCRVVKDLGEFDGAWTMWETGLMDEISLKTYDAMAYHVSQSTINRQRMKTVSLWSLQRTASAVMSALKQLTDPMSVQLKEVYVNGQMHPGLYDLLPLVPEV
ncbi:hypothetical protein NLJ89_g9324 [Agrocybe chaxingu]|uniref:C2H2-type domain-containing protein n=1 Tax=Agrocybe chaxingu TaxID=84603 RepID=A0A9W8MRY0_9AGAR|nr:hypothetical protein NLJ89_g9324 [Agrocybe chaxingu]